jgi:hypothetical protein
MIEYEYTYLNSPYYTSNSRNVRPTNSTRQKGKRRLGTMHS